MQDAEVGKAIATRLFARAVRRMQRGLLARGWRSWDYVSQLAAKRQREEQVAKKMACVCVCGGASRFAFVRPLHASFATRTRCMTPWRRSSTKLGPTDER